MVQEDTGSSIIFYTSALVSCKLCSVVHLFVHVRKHIQHIHVCVCLHSCRGTVTAVEKRGRGVGIGLGNGSSQPERQTGRGLQRESEAAWGPGALRNILSTALPGSTADTAPGTTSLCCQITTSKPGTSEWSGGPWLCQGGIGVFFLVLQTHWSSVTFNKIFTEAFSKSKSHNSGQLSLPFVINWFDSFS